MRHGRKLAVGSIATVAALLGSGDSPQAGQARGSLAVTVRVVVACGASVGQSGTVTAGACAPGAAALATARESASADTGGAAGGTTAAIETGDGVEYVTLFY